MRLPSYLPESKSLPPLHRPNSHKQCYAISLKRRGDSSYWRNETWLFKLSGKLDSETQPRIKAFFLIASRLESVSLTQCREGRESFLQLFEKTHRPAVATDKEA